MTGGGTLGLPLNWSWMHKPSVFLAVCQCERGGGSCRSGPGLNDGARNLCFRSALALWALTRPRSRCPVRWNKVEDALSIRRPPGPHSCQNGRVREAGTGMKMKCAEWPKEGRKERAGEVDRRDAVRVARCVAGGSIVPVNEDLGHCVQANL